MWCRVLCRALLVAAVITYLICVLFLSGVQKEELDVDTLSKLERHNVNIDDIDSKLKNECLLYSTAASTDLQETSTTETIPSITIPERQAESKTDKILKKTLFEQLIDCLNIKQDPDVNRRSNLVTKLPDDGDTIKEELSEADTDRSELQTKEMQATTEKLNATQTTTTPRTGRVNKIKYPQKNFIQFWQTHINNFYPKIVDGNKVNHKLPIVSAQTDNTFLQHIVNRSFINDMTLPLINPNHIFNGPVRDLKMNFYQENPFKEKITSYKTNALLNMTKLIGPEIKQKVEMGKIKPEEIVTENYNHKESMLNNYMPQNEFYNRLQYQRGTNNIQQGKKDSDINQLITQSYGRLYEKNRKIIQDPQIENKVNDIKQRYISTLDDVYTTEVNKFKKNEDIGNFMNLNISPDALEDIAKTIKDSVLRDLREEMFNSSVLNEENPTTTNELMSELTTSGKPTKENNEKKSGDATNVLQRIALMLEQLKPKKNISLSFLPPTFPVEQPTYNKSFIPYLLPNTIDKNKERILNIFTSNRKPIIELKGFKKVPPITIQTNSQEVPPLAISLKQPPLLIHQNIIITTQRPFIKGRNDRQRFNWDFDTEELNDQYTDISNAAPTNNTTKNNANSYLKRQRFAESKKKHSRHREWFTELAGIQDSRKPMYNLLKYTPHRSYNRYHEKLESLDSHQASENPSSAMLQDSDMLNIESRQQMSLNNMKKGTLYDGKNFKNFIETQEKVNDMLERLLATKKIFKMHSAENVK